MSKYQYVCENHKKPKPILFNTEMVRAILHGRKTQTRRPVEIELVASLETDKNNPDYLYVADKYGDSHHLLECAPYQKDDILYVRETFAELFDVNNGDQYYEYKADSGDPYPGEWPPEEARGNPDAPKWKPSIHMPKELARLFLKVTDVRVERLQEISNRDIRAEGAAEFGCTTHRVNFQIIWDEIYKEKGYGWNANPWVWVIEFERMEVE